MELPARKHIRLKEYNYAAGGAYFVTICTQGRVCLFSIPVGAAPCGRPDLTRSIAEKWMEKIPEKYPGVRVEKFVVMPNHIHALLLFDNMPTAGGHMGPPLPRIVDWYKTMTTNEYIRLVKVGKLMPFQKRVWQRGYYEHIIRDKNDLLIHWQYIEHNPACGADDPYYGEELQ